MPSDVNESLLIFFFLLWYLLFLDVCISNILYMIILKEGLDGLFMRPLSVDHTAHNNSCHLYGDKSDSLTCIYPHTEVTQQGD